MILYFLRHGETDWNAKERVQGITDTVLNKKGLQQAHDVAEKLAVENIEDSFPLPIDFVGNSESFMLKVRGDSMIDAGILDGDLVLVKKQNTAENGDIVVALIEDEATVKKFYKEKGFIRLQPQNQFMQPILVPTCTILGKVAGVFRKL